MRQQGRQQGSGGKAGKRLIGQPGAVVLVDQAVLGDSMDVKYQVFVSSTFVDLEAERRSVIETILNLKHIPVGMEAFQASDDTQWDYIKKRIDESDYYVVIVGERYGSELNGKSYTQMEYEYALAKGVPAAAFLLDPIARKSWPSDKVEFEKKAKVEKFRALCQKKLVKFWKNSDDLGARVASALNELINQKPRTGWVRADRLPSGRFMDEFAALSEEKRQLQAEVARLSADTDTLKIPPDIAWRIKTLDGTPASKVMGFDSAKGNFPSMLYLFMELVEMLTEGSIIHAIIGRVGDVTNIDVDQDDATRVLLDLMKRDLVETERRPFSLMSGTVMTHYKLSSFGKTFLMYAEEWVKIRDSESA
ncbi:DUF4062 domain-containing protein [Neorhizobium galegae]|nr:DUF4062 domain-containing protein [Neorhizobium galegae]